MSDVTMNLNLPLYNDTTDMATPFLTWRSAINGEVNSAFMKIDEEYGKLVEAMSKITGSAIKIEATGDGYGNFTATNMKIEKYNKDDVICFIPDMNCTGTTMLNINDLGNTSLQKINQDGTKINLEKNDFIKGHEYYFRYDGNVFVWQIQTNGKDITYIANSSLKSTNVSDALDELDNKADSLANERGYLTIKQYDDANTLTKSGKYIGFGNNLPDDGVWFINVSSGDVEIPDVNSSTSPPMSIECFEMTQIAIKVKNVDDTRSEPIIAVRNGSIGAIGWNDWQIIAFNKDIPTELPAKGGDSDTVDGSHAYEMQTLDTNGDSFGKTINVAKVQQQSDDNFKLIVGDGTNKTQVDFANNADTLDGKHYNEFVQFPITNLTVDELNDFNYPRSYRTNVNDGTTIGLPYAEWYHIDYFRHLDNNGYGFQIAYPYYNGRPMYRGSNDTAWGNWKYMADGGNADTVDGSHAWQLQTLDADGVPHSKDRWIASLKYDVDGDGCYKLFCHDDIDDMYIPTKVDDAANANKAGGLTVSHPYISELHITACGEESPLEVSEWIDFHKSDGSGNSDYDGRASINIATGDLVWANTIDTARNMNITQEILNLKASVANGKQAVVNAINNKLRYTSGLTVNNSGADYAWWINNKMGGNIRDIIEFNSWSSNAISYNSSSPTVTSGYLFNQIFNQSLKDSNIYFVITSGGGGYLDGNGYHEMTVNTTYHVECVSMTNFEILLQPNTTMQITADIVNQSITQWCSYK